MYSTLRKGLKCVFNYSVLSIVKSHSNSGKGGGVSMQSNSPPHPSQRFRESSGEVLCPFYSPCVRFKDPLHSGQ